MPETFAQYLEQWLKQSKAQGSNNLLIVCLLLTSMLLTICSIPITFRDAITYINLTDLKADKLEFAAKASAQRLADRIQKIEIDGLCMLL